MLTDRLAALERASRAGRTMGLDAEADAAASVLERARERSGFPGEGYVLALAGGTGVGKSSVLNALAGRVVSTVRAVRPTTDEPVAWVAAERRAELEPLLEWLGVRHVAGHADGSLAQVAILDLPDVDSVRTEHRKRVDELLPRIDAAAWVVDPEKYDDERLHGYLRSMVAHAPRLRLILNKTDRLTDADRELVADDLRRRLSADGIDGVPIHVVSATTGAGIDELRAALAAEADVKALVAAKLTADADEAIGRLARAAGVDTRAPDPLLPPDRRASAVREAQAGALALVDPPGLARQARAAVLSRARRTGGGVLGRTVDLIGRLSGSARRHADPAAHLAAWRRRGALGRAANPVRAALVEAAQAVPSSSRPGVLRALGAEATDKALGRAIDGAVSEIALDASPPGSVLWPLVGLLQLAAAAVLLFAIAWYLTLFLVPGGGPVATVEVPVLGALPMPLVLLAGALVAGAALGMLLSLHAGWIGRRFASNVGARVRERVSAAVETDAFGPLDRIDAARREIAEALRRPSIEG